jgi:hypothetical protein
VPAEVRKAMRFVPVDTVDQVLEHALAPRDAQPAREPRAARG